MPNLFISTEDQLKEYERIFLEARDQWSVDKDPRYLKIQTDCLRYIRSLKYSLDHVKVIDE
jgi:hypothetical protein